LFTKVRLVFPLLLETLVDNFGSNDRVNCASDGGFESDPHVRAVAFTHDGAGDRASPTVAFRVEVRRIKFRVHHHQVRLHTFRALVREIHEVAGRSFLLRAVSVATDHEVDIALIGEVIVREDHARAELLKQGIEELWFFGISRVGEELERLERDEMAMSEVDLDQRVLRGALVRDLLLHGDDGFRFGSNNDHFSHRRHGNLLRFLAQAHQDENDDDDEDDNGD